MATPQLTQIIEITRSAVVMKFTVVSAALFATSTSAFAPSRVTRPLTTALANDLFDGDKSSTTEKSKALPFVPRPKLLDGTLAADVGFE